MDLDLNEWQIGGVSAAVYNLKEVLRNLNYTQSVGVISNNISRVERDLEDQLETLKQLIK